MRDLAELYAEPDNRQQVIQAWRYYFGLFEGLRRNLVIGIAAAIGQALTLMPVPLLVGYIFDRAIPDGRLSLILLAGAGIYAVQLAYAGLALVNNRVIVNAYTKAIVRLRMALIEKIYMVSRSFYTTADTGEIQGLLVYDSRGVGLMSDVFFKKTLPAAIAALFLAAVLLWLDPVMFGVTMVVAPLLVVVVRYFSRGVRKKTHLARVAFHRLSGGIRRLQQLMDLTRQHGAEGYEKRGQKEVVEKEGRLRYELAEAITRYGQVQTLVFTLLTVLILVIGGNAVATGRLTMSELVQVFTVFVLLRSQVNILAQSSPAIIAGNEALFSLWEFLETPDERPYHGDTKIDFTGHVTVDSVSFAYEDKPTLWDICMRVAPGRQVSLIGPSGSGKTTIVNLILGFYRPDEGGILVDGHPLDEVDVPHLRRQVGLVSQDPILIPGTVRENIAYGLEGVSQEQIERAAEMAGLLRLVKELSDGFETDVGELGVLLSGGQRQRLALARALVRRPPMLILDEPTNHLDDQGVEELMAELRELKKDTSILIISHDKRLIARSDYVYMMREGRILSEGPPEFVRDSHPAPRAEAVRETGESIANLG